MCFTVNVILRGGVTKTRNSIQIFYFSSVAKNFLPVTLCSSGREKVNGPLTLCGIGAIRSILFALGFIKPTWEDSFCKLFSKSLHFSSLLHLFFFSASNLK